ncbi:hypothetical protein CN558_24035 [Bacillus wiedmannii]|uniref:hypothetical protein n=1 Tax=Bacillus wiedmannii TaxID=1890302 RepID=UPI000BEF2D80|nr:hypothetical protein [Bacillus wiedmannii]PEM93741.1 hypothetical protein CN627_00225 [Bacillus wiedmannii]PEO82211.1 hypothetical protein CN558_24035 [Bacillus wiedmannii]
MNAVSKEFKQTIHALRAANTYLDCLVQTKTYLQFLILIIFCIITVYIPFPLFMLNYINEVDILMQYIIKSVYFSFPISLVFLFIMRDQRFLFSKKITFQQLKFSFFCAFIIYAIMLFFLAVLISFTTFKGTSNPIGNEGITNLLYKTPGIAIQLIGENIMFVSILFFWHKIIRSFIISPISSITASLILSGSSFGLLHLSTYSYNWVQCLTFIGIPAIAQMIFFLIFKNIHMGYILHFNYNLIILLFSYIASI